MTDKPKPEGLALLREPFPANQISKLPKPTAAQTKAVKDDFKAGIRCEVCGGWHHPKVVHLDYVGHAALTDRLLDADPHWNWEPVAFTEKGTPAIDQNGGMWIKLTVCGVTRFGYGHPDGKTTADGIKETIGDALRNAAMRFGAALDLWHKGDLHAIDDAESPTGSEAKPAAPRHQSKPAPDHSQPVIYLQEAETLPHLAERWGKLPKETQRIPAVIRAKDARKAQLTPKEPAQSPITDDEIPHQ